MSPYYTPFPATLEKIVKADVREFLTMLSQQAAPVDDPTLLDWRHSKWVSFVEAHKGAMKEKEDVEMSVWEKRYLRRFNNKKLYERRKTCAKESSPKKFNPLARLRLGRRPTGRDAYILSQKPAILEETKKRHASDDSCRIGIYQQVIKKRWDDMTPDQQEQWNEQAKAEPMDTAPNAHVYRNQEQFASVFGDILRNSIGNGPDNVGHALYHLLYAFRKEDGGIDAGSITVGDELHSSVRFNPMCMSNTCLAKEWYRWSADLLPRDIVASEHPRMPYIGEQTAIGDIRRIVTTHLEHLWRGSCTSRRDSVIPWDVLSQNPSRFYDESSIPLGIKIRDPNELSVTQITTLAEFLQSSQGDGDAHNPGFRFYASLELENASDVTQTNPAPVLASANSPTDASIVQSNIELGPSLDDVEHHMAHPNIPSARDAVVTPEGHAIQDAVEDHEQGNIQDKDLLVHTKDNDSVSMPSNRNPAQVTPDVTITPKTKRNDGRVAMSTQSAMSTPSSERGENSHVMPDSSGDAHVRKSIRAPKSGHSHKRLTEDAPVGQNNVVAPKSKRRKVTIAKHPRTSTAHISEPCESIPSTLNSRPRRDRQQSWRAREAARQ